MGHIVAHLLIEGRQVVIGASNDASIERHVIPIQQVSCKDGRQDKKLLAAQAHDRQQHLHHGYGFTASRRTDLGQLAHVLVHFALEYFSGLHARVLGVQQAHQVMSPTLVPAQWQTLWLDLCLLQSCMMMDADIADAAKAYAMPSYALSSHARHLVCVALLQSDDRCIAASAADLQTAGKVGRTDCNSWRHSACPQMPV